MRKLESDFEKKLTQEVKALGGVSVKLNATLYRGIPDRLLLLPGGKAYFIELKAKKGKTSPHQKLWRKRLKDLGFEHEILEAEEIFSFLKGLHIEHSSI